MTPTHRASPSTRLSRHDLATTLRFPTKAALQQPSTAHHADEEEEEEEKKEETGSIASEDEANDISGAGEAVVRTWQHPGPLGFEVSARGPSREYPGGVVVSGVNPEAKGGVGGRVRIGLVVQRVGEAEVLAKSYNDVVAKLTDGKRPLRVVFCDEEVAAQLAPA